jgi:hypothetical protein
MRYKKEVRDNLAKRIERESSHGHYYDRLTVIAELIDDTDTQNALLSIKQLYNYFGCKPNGMHELLIELSGNLVVSMKRLGFNKEQLNRCYWGLYLNGQDNIWGIKPLPESVTEEARSNT